MSSVFDSIRSIISENSDLRNQHKVSMMEYGGPVGTSQGHAFNSNIYHDNNKKVVQSGIDKEKLNIKDRDKLYTPLKGQTKIIPPSEILARYKTAKKTMRGIYLYIILFVF